MFRWQANKTWAGLIGLNTLILLGISLCLVGFLPFFEPKAQEPGPDFAVELLGEKLVMLEENSLLSYPDPAQLDPKVAQRFKVVITAYSSSPWETDGDPFLTAAGTRVRDGIIANNLFPFGTQIRIPEIYGDKVFVVEDRMHWKKGYYHFDIWFPSYWEAKDFGAKRTYIEVLES